jgi:uncharacterized membrane protein (Fun14 family)
MKSADSSKILYFGFAEYRKFDNFSGSTPMTLSEIREKLGGFKPRWESVPAWKRKLLYAAAALGLFGLGSEGYQLVSPDISSEKTALPAEEKQATTVRSSAPQVSAPADGGFTWGGATGRLGGSFSLAFLAALALRWFVKTALTVAALSIAGAGVLLNYGVIDADQVGQITEWSQSLGPWLTEQTESAAAFLKGHLPSGAAGGAGFFLGLRK